MGHFVKRFWQNPLLVCLKESCQEIFGDRKKRNRGTFESIELHTRKSVQLNALARNFAQSMASEVQAAEFGETFSYGKVYYSSLNGEPVTLENHLDGVFEKFINNTGELCVTPADATELSLKADGHLFTIHFINLTNSLRSLIFKVSITPYVIQKLRRLI